MEDALLQVSVLIAMPSPYKPRAWDRSLAIRGKDHRVSGSGSDTNDSHSALRAPEEEEIPDVLFGVAEVPWKVPAPADAASDS